MKLLERKALRDEAYTAVLAGVLLDSVEYRISLLEKKAFLNQSEKSIHKELYKLRDCLFFFLVNRSISVVEGENSLEH